jgi:hypothetical protein
MKTFIISIFCLTLSLYASSQTNIKIILKTDLKIDRADVFDISQTEYHELSYGDTAIVKFQNQNIDFYNIRYFVSGKRYYKQIWLNPGNVTIKAHTTTSDLIIDTVMNSPAYYDAINYSKTSSEIAKRKDSMAYSDYLLTEIKKDINDPRSIKIAADYVNYNQNSRGNLLKLKVLLSNQREDFRKFIFYPMAIDRMNKILAIKTIQLLDYKFIDRKNRVASLELGKYDYAILDFWFVGCVPCMEQHKNIKTQYLKLQNQRIGTIGISTVNNYADWNKYLSEHGYHWDNYLQEGKNTLSKYLGINACPAYLLVNNKGEIIGSFNSWADVLNSLRSNNLISL